MILKPADTPVATPVPLTIVATVLSLLLQLPPPLALPNIVTLFWQIVDAPLIAAGSGFTTTVLVFWQPVGNAYVMMAVPAVLPVTTPATSTVATAVVPDVQLPPVVPLLSVVVWSRHTTAVPVISAGSGFTCIDDVT
jgi:hypothetical protein